MKNKKVLIKVVFFLSIIFFIFVGYLYTSSPTDFQVKTRSRKDLVYFQKDSSIPSKSGKSNGICAPPGCGPDASVEREDIKLELTAEQLTAVVNTLKPKKILVSNIKIKIDSGRIISTATSYYPIAPGKLTAISDLRLNHFYVEEVYIGSIRAPKKIKSFIEANGSGLIDQAFQENGVFVKSMRIKDNKFIFEASVPKNMVVIEGEVIKIYQSPTQNNTNLKPTGSIRY